ncbi:MAG: hypothetical protein JNK00_12975 [Flavipsychrobacter sp.]|nr:hypothetical protein [Flavipsychrobacter sp.]
MRTKITTGVYSYLVSTGAINQSQDVIEKAIREYWNMRKLESKKRKKLTEHSFTVSYTKNEHALIEQAAKESKLSRTRFIKEAALLYVSIIAHLGENFSVE